MPIPGQTLRNEATIPTAISSMHTEAFAMLLPIGAELLAYASISLGRLGRTARDARGGEPDNADIVLTRPFAWGLIGRDPGSQVSFVDPPAGVIE